MILALLRINAKYPLAMMHNKRAEGRQRGHNKRRSSGYAVRVAGLHTARMTHTIKIRRYRER